jgi:transcriptional regulator with XRE-family HTH domain
LAQRIDKLFKSVRPKGREFTYDEVAQGCEAAAAGTFSKTYVWQLRTGQRDNPTKRHLEALAAFFGVPVAYFFDDEAAERIESQLALAVALRDANVRDIALRTSSMDEATRQSVAQIVREISHIRQGRPNQALPSQGSANQGPPDQGRTEVSGGGR